MIVSQFTVAHRLSDGVSKFYRLLLTNLSDKDYSFRITLHSHYEWLDQDVAYVLGEWHPHWVLPKIQPAGKHRYLVRSMIDVRSHETQAFTLGPSKQDWIFARGYVELTVPETYTKLEVNIKDPSGPSTYEVQVSQGSDPVTVLLHPAEVTGKQDGSFSSLGYTDPAPIAVSTGKAENVITPDKVHTFEVQKNLEMVALLWAEANDEQKEGMLEEIAAFLEEPGSVTAVVAYLSRVGASAENVDVLNNFLSESGHAIRLTTSAREATPPPRKA